MAEHKELLTADDVLSVVELEDVRFFEVRGRLVDPHAETSAQEIDAPLQISIGQSEDLEHIGVRVRIELDTGQASFLVEAGAEYRLTTPASLGDSAKPEFVSRSALTTVLPFIREGLATTATRLRVRAPILPLVRPSTDLVVERDALDSQT